jgi:hypothetical protein
MYYETEPFGDHYQNFTIAAQTAVLANANSKRGGHTAADFLPQVGGGQRQSVEEDATQRTAQKLQALFDAMPGVFRKVK